MPRANSLKRQGVDADTQSADTLDIALLVAHSLRLRRPITKHCWQHLCAAAVLMC